MTEIVQQTTWPDSFWTAAWLPTSFLPQAPPTTEHAVGWIKNKPLACFTGNVYTDGSAKKPAYAPSLSRAGWGVVQIDAETCVGGLFGSLAGYEQTVPRAQLMAILVALKHG